MSKFVHKIVWLTCGEVSFIAPDGIQHENMPFELYGNLSMSRCRSVLKAEHNTNDLIVTIHARKRLIVKISVNDLMKCGTVIKEEVHKEN